MNVPIVLSFTAKDTITYLKALLFSLIKLAVIADMSYKRYFNILAFVIKVLIISAIKKRLLLS